MAQYRIVVTNQCNFQCVFCHREDCPTSRSPQQMHRSTIGRLAREMQVGGHTVAITGGEPFLHDDIMHMIRSVCCVGPGRVHVNTNGSLLGEYVDELAKLRGVGLHVNIPSLDREIYRAMTGVPLSGCLVEEILCVGRNTPTTVNVVCIAGWNRIEKNMAEMISFCAGAGLGLQLIHDYREDHRRESFTSFRAVCDRLLSDRGYMLSTAGAARYVYRSREHVVVVAAPCAPARDAEVGEVAAAIVVEPCGTTHRFGVVSE